MQFNTKEELYEFIQECINSYDIKDINITIIENSHKQNEEENNIDYKIEESSPKEYSFEITSLYETPQKVVVESIDTNVIYCKELNIKVNESNTCYTDFVNLFDSKILCNVCLDENAVPIVYLSFKLNEKEYLNEPFKLIKSDDNRIVVSSKYA
jgi:hypothetical protein